jgi:hypothetical protein
MIRSSFMLLLVLIFSFSTALNAADSDEAADNSYKVLFMGFMTNNGVGAVDLSTMKIERKPSKDGTGITIMIKSPVLDVGLDKDTGMLVEMSCKNPDLHRDINLPKEEKIKSIVTPLQAKKYIIDSRFFLQMGFSEKNNVFLNLDGIDNFQNGIFKIPRSSHGYDFDDEFVTIRMVRVNEKFIMSNLSSSLALKAVIPKVDQEKLLPIESQGKKAIENITNSAWILELLHERGISPDQLKEDISKRKTVFQHGNEFADLKKPALLLPDRSREIHHCYKYYYRAVGPIVEIYFVIYMDSSTPDSKIVAGYWDTIQADKK